MKLNILRLLVFTLAGGSAVLVITNVRAQKSSPAQTDFAVSLSTLGITVPSQTPAAPTVAQEQTVEQVQKNIKALNGMPQAQLIPAMNFFAASLGVRCNYCHVNPFASDEKPQKLMARKMLAMVKGVSKNFYGGGNTPVQCYNCHQGHPKPPEGVKAE